MEDIKKEFESLIEQTGWQGESPIVETKPTPEEFFAEDTIALAETTLSPVSGNPLIKVPQSFIKVDGDRTQLTEMQMSAVVDEVIDQQDGYSIPLGFPSLIDQAIVDSKLSAIYQRIESLEETNKKIIAALKHLGLDTNKHFR